MEDKVELRPLKVDMEELEIAFEGWGGEADWYLDVQTGEVIRPPEGTFGELEDLYEEIEDEEPSEEQLSEALHEHTLANFEEEDILVAHRIESDAEGRYLKVESEDSGEAYRDMEAFCGTVANERLRDRLEVALDGRGAFRRFKDVLAGYPAEREQWFAFKSARLRERITDWLHSEGIEPIHVRRLPS